MVLRLSEMPKKTMLRMRSKMSIWKVTSVNAMRSGILEDDEDATQKLA